VFRKAPGGARSPLVEAFAVLAAAVRGPHPDQGLMISRLCYDVVGGHRDADDPETELLRRLGRRRTVTLDSAATAVRPR